MLSGELVYLVTSGLYSDYRVVAVCSSEERAKQCVDEYERVYRKLVPNCKYGGEYRIEQYELDVYTAE